jgi:integrase/recombinase XerD
LGQELAAAKSLTSVEIQQVLDNIATQPNAARNRAMFMLTVGAGLRVSEVAGLLVGDVLDCKGLVKSEIYLAAHRVKHAHARRVFLNSRVQRELQIYLATKQQIAQELPLFPTNRGARYCFSSNTLTQHFFWMYRKANIPGASSHSGRKTFLTSLASQGISVFILASLAGHKSISTTQRYITVNDDAKRKAVELV